MAFEMQVMVDVIAGQLCKWFDFECYFCAQNLTAAGVQSVTINMSVTYVSYLESHMSYLHKIISVCVVCGCGSILPPRQCSICSTSFMDNVIFQFSRNEIIATARPLWTGLAKVGMHSKFTA